MKIAAALSRLTAFEKIWFSFFGAVMRDEFQAKMIGELKRRGIDYVVVRGSVEERLAFVRRVLGEKFP